jgi:3-hydroxyisobutyrate dehydrogenase-like beta-hydroxyacid dehydrogenase
LKIIGNALILGQIELLAETMTLADKAEVGAANVSALTLRKGDNSTDDAQLYDVIKGQRISDLQYRGYSAKRMGFD